jgi:hypothetical protein
MERPRLLPTSATDETFAGVTYHLDRELVPVLTIELDARVIWLHGYGNVFEKQLGGGESIDVEPAAGCTRIHTCKWRRTSRACRPDSAASR